MPDEAGPGMLPARHAPLPASPPLPPLPPRPNLALVLLGAPRLLPAAGEPVALERRTAALLALLVLQGAMPRARAASLVWPEADDARAGNSLRQRIYKLRHAAARDVIVSDRHIALAPDIAHDLAAPLARLADDGEACRGELLGALDFADCAELNEWVALARQRWRAEVARALAELASRREGEGRIAGALGLAERLVQLEPTAEHAHRRVMRLHYLRGDRAAALEAFERCRLVLRAELGVLPDAETQQLRQIIENAGAGAPVRSAPPAPVSMLRPPRLVGREAEWRRLEHSLEQRRTALVLGEAGIGKSRLLADLAAAHNGLRVAARPGDAAVPFAFLARLLRALWAGGAAQPAGQVRSELARILPELGSAPQGPFSLLRLREAVQAAVCELAGAAAGGPQLLALDDAHFADAATLDMLPALAACGGATGTNWLLAARPGELPPAVGAWVRAEDADALNVLTLQPLDEAGVAELLATLALPGLDASRWAPALHRHTGGNPMFVLETLRALLQRGAAALDEVPAALPLPEDVGSLIERRLAQLGTDALDLARVAALAGQDFTPELAAQVLERRVIDLAAPWAELEAAHVIREQAFAHDLVLEAVQRSVPAAVGRALHRAIALRLQATQAPPARLAEHWERGGDTEAACTAFLAAAAASRTASRIDEEHSLLERALACLGAGDCEQRTCRVLHQAAVAAFELGRYDDFRQAAAKLQSAAVAPPERLLALDAKLRVQCQDLAFEAMEATWTEAQALAAVHGTEVQQVTLAELKATALARMNRYDEAIEALQLGFAWIEREPDHPWVSGFLLDAAATMSYVGRYREAGRIARRAHASAERHGVVRHMHNALPIVGMVEYLLADVEASAAAYEGCLALTERFGGDRLQNSVHRCELAFCQRVMGRFDEAMRHAQAHADQCRESNPGEWWQVWADLELVRGWYELGQHARALAVLGSRAPENDDARFRWLLVRYRVQAAEAGERRRWLEELTRLAEGGIRSTGKRWTLAPDLCAAQPLDEAGATIERHIAACQDAGALIYVVPMRLRLAHTLLGAGRVPQALAQAEAVLSESAGRPPYGMYLPEAWSILHRVFIAAGRPAEGASALRAAQRWIVQTALPNVPEPFRESFLHRNPVNRDILAAASRAGLGPLPLPPSQ